MLLSKETLEYFGRLGSLARQGMQPSHARVPYAIAGEEVLLKYECLRSVWAERHSIKAACARFGIARSSYYAVEADFVRHGLCGLFPDLAQGKQCPELERLVLLVKEARPSLTHTAILRIAEAIPVTKQTADVEMVGRILTSHGCGVSSLATDRSFWSRIQRTLAELRRVKKRPLGQRDPRARKETFSIDDDLPHRRLELLRSLFSTQSAGVKETCMQFGTPMSSFYRLVDDYLLYGPWAVLPAPRPGSKDSIASETQLRILLEQLRRPTASGQDIVDALDLRCSRHVVNRITSRWGLGAREVAPVALEEFIGEPAGQTPEAFQPPTSAFQVYSAQGLMESRRMNRHFELICQKMTKRVYHICDPGPILLAPFVNHLGIVPSFELYGPARLRGKEITNLALLNVMRILAGYECVHHLRANTDRSVAFASGIGLFGSSSKFYEDTLAFKFDHLHQMRLDLVARAKELDLIEGTRVGFDFHFKEFYGHAAAEKGIGKGPNKAGDLVAGFRPHIAWDLARNVILSIAYYQGATRAPRIIRRFCEQNLFPVLDPRALREIYMDSEYTKEGDIRYFTETTGANGDVYICLKKNKQIKKLIEPALETEAGWELHEGEDEKKSMDVVLPKTGVPMRVVILRNRETKEHIRCFGSTNTKIPQDEILNKYRFRWTIENGIKDLVRSYFVDKIYGADPEKVEFEFYCVMVARIAYEYFLLELGGDRYVREDGSKQTLASMRTALFQKRNCTIGVDSSDNIVLTFLDSCGDSFERRVSAAYDKLAEKGIADVLWWGNRRLKVRFGDQYRSAKVSGGTA